MPSPCRSGFAKEPLRSTRNYPPVLLSYLVSPNLPSRRRVDCTEDFSQFSFSFCSKAAFLFASERQPLHLTLALRRRTGLPMPVECPPPPLLYCTKLDTRTESLPVCPARKLLTPRSPSQCLCSAGAPRAGSLGFVGCMLGSLSKVQCKAGPNPNTGRGGGCLFWIQKCEKKRLKDEERGEGPVKRVKRVGGKALGWGGGRRFRGARHGCRSIGVCGQSF